MVGINRNTAINFYDKIRQIIAFNLELGSSFLCGEVDVDESYFGGSRKGKRGCGSDFFSIKFSPILKHRLSLFSNNDLMVIFTLSSLHQSNIISTDKKQ